MTRTASRFTGNCSKERQTKSMVNTMFNPLVKNGFSHRFHLDEPTFIFRGIGSIFFIFISFFDENQVRKQNSPSRDAAFCGVTSGAILFACVARLIWVKISHLQVGFLY